MIFHGFTEIQKPSKSTDLAPSWDILSASWPNLALSWPILEPILAQLVPLLAHLGPLLAHLGHILAHLGTQMAKKWKKNIEKPTAFHIFCRENDRPNPAIRNNLAPSCCPSPLNPSPFIARLLGPTPRMPKLETSRHAFRHPPIRRVRDNDVCLGTMMSVKSKVSACTPGVRRGGSAGERGGGGRGEGRVFRTEFAPQREKIQSVCVQVRV